MANSKKVLVFGTTGEIGGRIARGCAEAGHDVTGVSRGTRTGHRVDLPGVELLVADKGDPDCFKTTLAGREFDVVIDSVPKPEHIDLVCEHFNGRIEHYFICGSTGSYAPLKYLPADEAHPWREQTEVNFFDQCERDAAALELCREKGFPVTIFRPTNIIGVGRIPLELWGGRDLLFFQLMAKHETVELPVNGNILVQSGCNDDLADAFVLAASKGTEIVGEIFIISSKKAITLDRYFETAKEVLGSRSTVEVLSIDQILERRPDHSTYFGLRFLVEHMCFDISKAERMLGYRPRVTPEQGLEMALGWCRDSGLL